MKIRIGRMTDYFLSSHTVNGYRSFFDEASKTYQHIIGLSGASTQIRSRIARQIGILLNDRGYHIELIHGLNNPWDFEGVAVPQLKLLMADAKRLKVNDDAENPYHTIDLDQFILPEQYMIFEAKLKDLQEQMAVDLELLYEYLWQEQAKLTNDDGGLAFTERQTDHLVDRLAKMLFFESDGVLINRFAQTLTGEGQTDYYHSILKDTRKKYYINGVNYKSGCHILKDLANEAVKAGLICEAYHDWLYDDLIELLILPQKEIAIAARSLGDDFVELLTYKETAREPALEKNKCSFWSNDLARIDNLLKEMQRLGDTIGDLYQEMIDFTAIERLEETLLGKILAQSRQSL